jgi:hypothetical protein
MPAAASRTSRPLAIVLFLPSVATVRSHFDFCVPLYAAIRLSAVGGLLLADQRTRMHDPLSTARMLKAASTSSDLNRPCSIGNDRGLDRTVN